MNTHPYPSPASPLRTWARFPLAALILSLSGFAIPAFAIEVANTNDSGSGSLRQAILDAAPGETITFAPTLDGMTVRLTSGQLSIDRDLVIDASALANGIVISGDADSSGTPSAGDSRVFDVGAFTVEFRALTIRDGKAGDGSLGDGGQRGGGIYNAGDLTLVDCLVTGNETGRGGDISDMGSAFAGGGGHGGGIYSLGGTTLTLRNSTVSENRAGDGGEADSQGFGDAFGGGGGSGGGIFCAGTVTLVDCEIRGNVAGDGGAATGGVPSIEGQGGFGGGIAIAGNDAHLVVRNSTVAGNVAGQDYAFGGGISATYAGTVTIVNSTIAGNQVPGPHAERGGGIFLEATPAELIHATVVGNTIVGDGVGGGIGLLGNPVVTLENTIVAGNTAAVSGDDLFGAFTAAGRNFIGDTTDATGLGAPLTGDPLLGMLADNGGPTETIAPLAGSPVINLAIATGNSPADDQRGFTRPFDGAPDIGAVEYGSSPPPQVNPGLVAKLKRQISQTKEAVRQLKKKGRTAQARKHQKKLKLLRKKLGALR